MRRLAIALLVVVAFFVSTDYSLVARQQNETPAAAQPNDAPKGGEWNFSDEEEAVPTFGQDLKEQAGSLLTFAAFATLALVGFFRKSEPLKWITMGVAVSSISDSGRVS
jgi:hypothetical protein